MSALMCPTCADGTVEYQQHAGNSVCTSCGAVLEENAIVSEIMFGESSSGAAVVQGSYVGADQVRARAPQGYRSRGGGESREQTLANGRKEISSLAVGLGLSANMADAGQRYFMLAVNQGFTQGRRTKYVVAACLYSACRMNKTSHMLIDFSDILQINVFVLGATYLKLVKQLNLKLPTIDPSVYISRFAALLEFGDETQKVAQDATRLVARMSRDWIQHGRRPAGVCGACLYLAARMNNFRRSLLEIVQVVKIADVTLRKRLAEFQSTASGQLSVEEFRSLWLEESADPPAYSTQAKDQALTVAGKKRKRGLPPTNDEREGAEAMLELAGGADPDPDPDDDADDGDGNEEEEEEGATAGQDIPEGFDQEMEKEMHSALDTEEGMQISKDVDEIEAKRRVLTAQQIQLNQDDSLDNLDEDELDAFILTPEEVDAKSRLWMDLNKDYLQVLANKQLTAEGELKPQTTRKPRKKVKPRDSTNATGTNAAEATRILLAKKRYSKKINYSVMSDLFAKDKGNTPGGSTGTSGRQGAFIGSRVRTESPTSFPSPTWRKDGAGPSRRRDETIEPMDEGDSEDDDDNAPAAAGATAAGRRGDDEDDDDGDQEWRRFGQRNDEEQFSADEEL